MDVHTMKLQPHTRCCVKTICLGALILKFSLEELVVLLRFHMTTLVREDLLYLAPTTDPGNVTFQQLKFVSTTIAFRLTLAWSLQLECFSIKLQEPCPVTMSQVIKWPSYTESRPLFLNQSTLGFHFGIGEMTHRWLFVIFLSTISKYNLY